MPARLVDEVEFIRLLGAPFAGGTELRDAVEMVVNGERLSELLGGLPLDVSEVPTNWSTRGCGAGTTSPSVGARGDAGCIRAQAQIVRRGPVAEWTVPSIGRKFHFDGADLERELRRALAAHR